MTKLYQIIVRDDRIACDIQQALNSEESIHLLNLGYFSTPQEAKADLIQKLNGKIELANVKASREVKFLNTLIEMAKEF